MRPGDARAVTLLANLAMGVMAASLFVNGVSTGNVKITPDGVPWMWSEAR